MLMSNPAPNVLSRLTIKNVRLPPEAYSSLHHIKPSQDKQVQLPLVDLDYVHLEPSPSNPSSSLVEVLVSSSAAASTAGPPFDSTRPFSSICNDSIPNTQSKPESHTHSQVVSRFTTSSSASSHISACIDAHGNLSIPGGLCHPHIHLDKPYLLSRTPLSSGTFEEALTSTSTAKAQFVPSDVEFRMRRLIASSISHGVTSMRAFVEVDPTVGLMCLDEAVKLKREFEGKCEVQLVAFAQDAIFYPDDEETEKEMQRLMNEAAQRVEVDVVGSAPYVESLSKNDQSSLGDRERTLKQKAQQRKNIRFIFDLARNHGKHVDFHLDYDLLPPGSEEDGAESMIPHVLSLSSTRLWNHCTTGKNRSVTMGHCTKLTSFTSDHLSHLSTFPASDPPVSFIALPPSDLYMQGRETPYSTRSRATIPLLELHSNPALKNFNWAMGVNNVANLFTPQGDADPLAVLPMMVAVWQSAKPEDCETLIGAISRNARLAAGLACSYDTLDQDGSEEKSRNIWTDLTVIDGSTSVQDAVCAPSFGRLTIKDGRIVARRRVDSVVY
ncbi:uncharacterized protein UTRI_06667 [Ustilago trichophora]|uniref:Metallo-dependent hydrolase n=1 Tax=Ustilago trichophora TaxID=86804 RepID=A0A5C3ENZ8_9BASI|nr:uncharacterized protein UTRI_06667 [Ustilago trichophora]